MLSIRFVVEAIERYDNAVKELETIEAQFYKHTGLTEYDDSIVYAIYRCPKLPIESVKNIDDLARVDKLQSDFTNKLQRIISDHRSIVEVIENSVQELIEYVHEMPYHNEGIQIKYTARSGTKYVYGYVWNPYNDEIRDSVFHSI